MKLALVFVLLLSSLAFGYTMQEESGICLPEHHMAEQKDAKYCQCMAMGGYQLCHKGKSFSFQEWREENERRNEETNPKKRQPQIPQCMMACKEEHCECCAYMEKFHQVPKKRVAITIPYDSLE
jgi:hypothetical protein